MPADWKARAAEQTRTFWASVRTRKPAKPGARCPTPAASVREGPVPADSLSVDDCAANWAVHRNTARRRLAYYHRRFGEKYVWRVGKRREYRTNERCLAQICTMLDKKTEMVSKEEFSREVSRLWRAVRAMHEKR